MKNVSNALPQLTHCSPGELEKHVWSWKFVSRSSVNLGYSQSKSFGSFWSMEQTCYLALYLSFFLLKENQCLAWGGFACMHAAPPHPYPHPHRHPACRDWLLLYCSVGLGAFVTRRFVKGWTVRRYTPVTFFPLVKMMTNCLAVNLKVPKWHFCQSL